jgi:hypothetical protein
VSLYRFKRRHGMHSKLRATAAQQMQLPLACRLSTNRVRSDVSQR